jgi:peptidoglycan hydrolase-like protein with peptidoglycan-binding domain
MITFRNIAPLVAAAALVGLAGCSGGSSQQAAATPPAAPPPAPAPAPPPASMANPMAPSTLRQVQTALKQQGLYKGRVDGKWGPMTEHGVMAFQQKNNLQATGQLDQATLSAMNIGGSSSSMNMGAGGSMGSSGGAPMAGSGAPAGTSGTTNP